MTSSSSQSVAITGAGAGLGRDIALGLAAKGYVIFGTAMSAAARTVIELAEQVPPRSRASVGPDADEMFRTVREKSDAEQDAFRLQLVGLG